MTKAGEKLLAAAKEALEVSRCDHDTVKSPAQPTGDYTRYLCTKCGASFYVPTPHLKGE